MDVIVKAIALMEYTMTITSNRKRYSSKHIILVQRIQNCCMDIYEHLLDANRTSLDRNKEERQRLQSFAISGCDKLSCYAEISMNLHIIGSNTAEHWQKLINDVKYMAISWRKNEFFKK